VQVARFASVSLDISDFPTRHNYGLALWQKHIERILAGWVDELGVPTYRGREVTGFVQDDTSVDVALSDGQSLHAEYLVGCDGGRSLIRKSAGIDFPGSDPTTSNLIAEVEMTEEPEWGIRRDALGIHALSRLENGSVRVLVTEQQVGATGEPTLRDLSEALIAVYGTDYGVHSPTSISRFTDMTRQAASYRKGRVLLAGDAAHVHPPDGGQGLQTGVQDAVNLGWKVVKGARAGTLRPGNGRSCLQTRFARASGHFATERSERDRRTPEASVEGGSDFSRSTAALDPNVWSGDTGTRRVTTVRGATRCQWRARHQGNAWGGPQAFPPRLIYCTVLARSAKLPTPPWPPAMRSIWMPIFWMPFTSAVVPGLAGGICGAGLQMSVTKPSFASGM
jgi:2-polyprenyl-6-methoxyphenol hydroxylase-like FAD-dependent oxidoreductase